MGVLGDELLILRGETELADQSGNGRNASYSGGMGLAVDIAIGGTVAYSYDGSDDYMQVPSFPAVSTEYSIMYWGKPTSDGSFRQVFSKSYGGGNSILCYLSNGGIWARHHLNTATGSAAWLNYATKPTLGSWVHVAITFRSGTGWSIYYDGVLVASGTSSGSPNAVEDGTGTAYIGYTTQTLFGSLRHYHGRMDDFRFFNRAVTAGEVASVVAAGRDYSTQSGGTLFTGIGRNRRLGT